MSGRIPNSNTNRFMRAGNLGFPAPRPRQSSLSPARVGRSDARQQTGATGLPRDHSSTARGTSLFRTESPVSRFFEQQRRAAAESGRFQERGRPQQQGAAQTAPQRPQPSTTSAQEASPPPFRQFRMSREQRMVDLTRRAASPAAAKVIIDTTDNTPPPPRVYSRFELLMGKNLTGAPRQQAQPSRQPSRSSQQATANDLGARPKTTAPQRPAVNLSSSAQSPSITPKQQPSSKFSVQDSNPAPLGKKVSSRFDALLKPIRSEEDEEYDSPPPSVLPIIADPNLKSALKRTIGEPNLDISKLERDPQMPAPRLYTKAEDPHRILFNKKKVARLSQALRREAQKAEAFENKVNQKLNNRRLSSTQKLAIKTELRRERTIMYKVAAEVYFKAQPLIPNVHNEQMFNQMNADSRLIDQIYARLNAMLAPLSLFDGEPISEQNPAIKGETYVHHVVFQEEGIAKPAGQKAVKFEKTAGVDFYLKEKDAMKELGPVAELNPELFVNGVWIGEDDE